MKRRTMAFALATGWAMPALAQGGDAAWPGGKPIRLIVPFAAGGGTDLVARTLAEKLGATLNQTIIVDNKPGASGVIAMETAARAAPDGYTLVLGSASTVVVNPAVLPELPYDPVNGFEHIGDVGSASVVMVGHPDFPAKNLRDVIARAKAKPGELNYGTWGNGSTGHMCAEMVRAATGVQMTHVPYKGAAPVLNDVAAGHIKLGFADVQSVVPMAKSGKVKVLASCARRSINFPDVPGYVEQGVDFDFVWRYDLMAPAKTPQPIIDRLHAELMTVLALPDIKARWAEFGMTASTISPTALKAQTGRDVAALTKLARDAGIRP
ncbi:MAG TPA: tripartite tricarboxylate transporter substrate-binding protein [Vineibacter sp.]|nr:tripartite tricarboxylate transporter substrate-binding protein [Vineibacter sp.]